MLDIIFNSMNDAASHSEGVVAVMFDARDSISCPEDTSKNATDRMKFFGRPGFIIMEPIINQRNRVANTHWGFVQNHVAQSDVIMADTFPLHTLYGFHHFPGDGLDECRAPIRLRHQLNPLFHKPHDRSPCSKQSPTGTGSGLKLENKLSKHATMYFCGVGRASCLGPTSWR